MLIDLDYMNLLFQELNEKLISKEVVAEIYLVGGAAIIINGGRESSRDIDAFFKPTLIIRECAEEIAYTHDLPSDWLNDGAKGFMTPHMEFDVYQKLSNLTIYVIQKEGLLAMKLTSARSGAGSSDIQDSLFLMRELSISSIDELYKLVEQYMAENQMTAKCNFFIQAVWEMYQFQT